MGHFYIQVTLFKGNEWVFSEIIYVLWNMVYIMFKSTEEKCRILHNIGFEFRYYIIF